MSTSEDHMAWSPTQLPFARSYCAAPGRLFAGCYPGDPDPAQAQTKLAGLVRCGVLCVINLMESGEVNNSGKPFVDYRPTLEDLARKAGQSVCYQRLPIRDMGVPAQDYMRKILDTIDDANDAGQIVYVHCWGGKGRTGTVVGCYLARHGLAVGNTALEKLNELTKMAQYDFGYVPQTAAQCDFVRTWRSGQ